MDRKNISIEGPQAFQSAHINSVLTQRSLLKDPADMLDQEV